MRCLYCGKRLSLLHKLSRREFCDNSHHSLYMESQDSMGLARLIEAKQVAKRRPSRPAESASAAAPPPTVERFVTQFPKTQNCFRPAFTAGHVLPVAITVSLPAVDLELSGCGIRRGESEAGLTSRDVTRNCAPAHQPEFLTTERALRYPQPPPPAAPAVSEPPIPGFLPAVARAPRTVPASIAREIPLQTFEVPALTYPGFVPEGAVNLSAAPGVRATGLDRLNAGAPPETSHPAAGEFHVSEPIPASLNHLPALPAVADSNTLRNLEHQVAGFAAGGPAALNVALCRPVETAPPDLSPPAPLVGVLAGLSSCAVPLGSAVEWGFGTAAPRPARRDEAGIPEAVPGCIAWPNMGLAPGRLQSCGAADLGAATRAAKVRRQPVTSVPAGAVLPLIPPQPAGPAPVRGLTAAGLSQLSPGPGPAFRTVRRTAPTPEAAAPFLLPPKSSGLLPPCALPAAELVLLPIVLRRTCTPPAVTIPTPLGNAPAAMWVPVNDPAASRTAGIPASAQLRPLAFERLTPRFGPAAGRPVAVALDEALPESSLGAFTAALNPASPQGCALPRPLAAELFPLSLELVAALVGGSESKTELSPEPVRPEISMPRLNARPVKDAVTPMEPVHKLGPPLWQRILNPAVGTLRATPASIRWILMAIPVIGILMWHVANREEAVIATTSEPAEAASVLATRWQNFQENVSSRAAIALTDDFRSGLSDWSGVEGWSKTWAYDESGFARPGAWAIYRPTEALSDYQFEFATVIEQGGVNWVFRATDPNNYYYARLSITEPGPLPEAAIDWYAVIDGKRSERTRTPLPFPLRNEKMYRIRLVARGHGFTTFLDDRVINFFQDDRLPTGGVGFFQSREDKVRLRWISVIHQYDMLGRLCALIAPYDFQSATRSVTQ